MKSGLSIGNFIFGDLHSLPLAVLCILPPDGGDFESCCLRRGRFVFFGENFSNLPVDFHENGENEDENAIDVYNLLKMW